MADAADPAVPADPADQSAPAGSASSPEPAVRQSAVRQSAVPESAPGPVSPGRGFLVRRWTEQDWPAVRAIRLRMLADAPLAYLETLDHALTLPDREWMLRARRGAAGASALDVVAEAPGGGWLGVMGAYVDRPGSAVLVSVFVEPAARGRARGVTGALLRAVEDWARTVGATRLRLLVHEHNDRALGYYRGAGFTVTGRREPYVLDPSASEIEMDKALDRPA